MARHRHGSPGCQGNRAIAVTHCGMRVVLDHNNRGRTPVLCRIFPVHSQGTVIALTSHIREVTSDSITSPTGAPSIRETERRSTMRTDNIVRFRTLDKARPTNRLN